MVKRFKQYRYGIITTVVILVILTIAFFSGGELPSNQEETELSAETVYLAQQEDIDGIETEAATQEETSTSGESVTAETESIEIDSTRTDESETDKQETTTSQQEAATGKQKQTTKKQETATSQTEQATKKQKDSGKKNHTSKQEAVTTQKEQATTKKQATTKEQATTSKQATTKEQTTTKQQETQPATTKETTATGEKITVTLSISCKTVLSNMEKLTAAKKSIIPADGWILETVTVEAREGQSVFDVLQQVCKEEKIPMEFSKSAVYKTAYIEGINNLYEFDCGAASGWMYSVNGTFPNYGCSAYSLKNGDEIAFLYTCTNGTDLK